MRHLATIFAHRSVIAMVALLSYGFAGVPQGWQGQVSAEESAPKSRAWEGLQIQPGDDGLELFKPLKPLTADDEQRKVALAWYGVAQYEFSQGHRSKAYESLKKASAADPDSPQLLFMLLQLAIAENKQDEAYEYSLRLSEVSPTESAELIRRLGTLLSKEPGGIPRAIRLYEQAAHSPKINKESGFYVFLMKELGKLYLSTQRNGDAATCFEAVFDAIRNHEKYKLSSRERRELSSDQSIDPDALGDIFLEVGKFDLAREAYEHSAKGRKSSQFMLHYHLAKLEMKQNAPEKALAELDQFFASDAKIRNREQLELLNQTLTALNRQGELIGRLEGYLQKHTDSTALMIYLAERYADAERLAEAESLLKKVLEEGSDTTALLAMARVSRRLGKVPEYLDSLSEAYDRKEDASILDPELAAIEQDPNLWESMWKLADSRMKESPPTLEYEGAYVAAKAGMKLKKTEEVSSLLKYAATKNKREAAKMYAELADYYLDVDKFIEAGDLLKMGAEDPSVGDGRENFLLQASQAYEMGGQTETALQILAEAKKTLPDHPLLMYQEGWVYSHAGRYEEAIGQFEKAIQKAGEMRMDQLVRTSRLNLSNVYVLKGEMQKGEEILEVILKDSPDDPSVNNDLGYLYADQGKNLEQAKEMITKALNAEPENGAYLDSMGWVLHKLGNQEEALKYLLKSSEKSTTSGDATIWDHVGDVYKAMNQMEEAKKYWTKALEMAKSAPKQNSELIGKIEAKLK